MQSKSIAIIEVTKGFLSCKAVEDIPSGSFLTDLWGPVLDSPHSHTVQVDKNKHVVPEGPMNVFNHSCQPNAKWVYEHHKAAYPGLDASHDVFWYMVAVRDIEKGEDVTFDYTTSEYDMAQSFQCKCGTEMCLGEIKGFKYLSPQQQRERRNDLSPVIIEIWDKNP